MLQRSKPTPQQLVQWDETRAALMWYCPAFTHIFYTLMNKDDHICVFTDIPDIPVAATDGNSVIVNTGPKGFFKYGLMERLFITAHEILHCVLNHIILGHNLRKSGKVHVNNRTYPYYPRLMNKAMDLVINAILVDSKIGKMPDDALYDPDLATAADSVLDVYATLIKQLQSGSGKRPGDQPGGGGTGDGKGEEGEEEGEGDAPRGEGFDEHLAPGTADGVHPHQAVEDHNPAEWETVIKAAMDSARLQGKLPASLQRMFEEVTTTEIDWTEIIKSWFARKVGSGSLNWRKPDRQLIVRDIWAPGRSGHGADLVVLGMDTSGSISQTEVSLWLGVLGEILEQLRPKRVVVIWCDAAIGRVDEVEDVGDIASIRKKGAPGGGGTDFRPVFDHIYEERMEPDCLVFLTDGYGSFPDHEPGYPVCWGSISLKPENYPFGDVVMLPTEQ